MPRGMPVTDRRQETSQSEYHPGGGFGDVGPGGKVIGIFGYDISAAPTTGEVLVFDGTNWTPAYGLTWFNVKNYGAVGDNTTDDTTAINSAIAALNTALRGVLYFPAAIYKVTGALTAITAQALVLGDGSGAWDQTSPVSQVNCTSQTAVLFTVTGASGMVRGLSLRNTYAGTPTSASRGFTQTPTTGEESWSFDDVSTRGFYTNIEIGGATGWAMVRCWNYGPVAYGLTIANSVVPDAGDWSISDSHFFSATYNSTAGVHIESSGGGKFTNCKFNMGTDSPSKQFSYGIDLSVQASTSILLVANCSFENVSSDAIHVTTAAGTKRYAFGEIANCQFGLYGNNTGRAINLNATTASDLHQWVIVGNSFHTNGTARAAISLTKCDNILIGPNQIDGTGFTSYLTTSTCTNIRDYTGGIAGGIAVTLDGNAAHYLDGTGAMSTPAGSGMTNPMTTLDDLIKGGTVTAGVAAPVRLGIGAVGGHLSRLNGIVDWDSGTSNPTAASGDRYYRSDLAQETFYDGTRWRTLADVHMPMGIVAGTLPISATSNGFQRAPIPYQGIYAFYITRVLTAFFVSSGATALDNSNKWVGSVLDDSGASIYTITINSGASGSWRRDDSGALAVNLATTKFDMEINWTKTGTPGSLYMVVSVVGRPVIP